MGIYIIIFLIIVGSLMLSVYSNEVLFWVTFSIYFDPGGFLYAIAPSGLPNNLRFWDIFIVIMIYAYYRRFGLAIKFSDNHVELRNLFFWFLAFVVVSFTFCYGILAPLINDYSDPGTFFWRNRTTYYGIILFMMIYRFSMVDRNGYFLKAIIYPALVILPLFMLDQVFNLGIVTTYQNERYYGTGIIRITLESYGLMYYCFSLMLWVLFLGGGGTVQPRIPISKNLIVLSGSLMVVVVIFSLTRRTILDIFFTTIVAWILANLVRRQFGNFLNIMKLLIPLVIIVTVISVTLPQYLGWFGKVVSNTTSLIMTGVDEEGRTDARVSGEGGLLLAKQYIKDNPLLGSGYYPKTYVQVVEEARAGDAFSVGYNDSAEVLFWGFPMRFGVVGLLFEIIIYFVFLKFVLKAFRLIRKNIWYVLSYHFVEASTILLITVLLINQFTINIMSLGTALTDRMAFNLFCSFAALMGTCYYKIRNSLSKHEKVH